MVKCIGSKDKALRNQVFVLLYLKKSHSQNLPASDMISVLIENEVYSLATIVIGPEDMAVQKKYSDDLALHFRKSAKLRRYEFTYNIRTYGCQLNESDSEKLSGILKSLSFIPGSTDDPDLVIF